MNRSLILCRVNSQTDTFKLTATVVDSPDPHLLGLQGVKPEQWGETQVNVRRKTTAKIEPRTFLL